jgi:hypothetical protein
MFRSELPEVTLMMPTLLDVLRHIKVNEKKTDATLTQLAILGDAAKKEIRRRGQATRTYPGGERSDAAKAHIDQQVVAGLLIALRARNPLAEQMLASIRRKRGNR